MKSRACIPYAVMQANPRSQGCSILVHKFHQRVLSWSVTFKITF
jgi:hypothetical protein